MQSGNGVSSPIRHQSTQQPTDGSQILQPDFPVSPVLATGESQAPDTVPEEPDKEGDKSAPERSEDVGLCVGSYFAAGISPPLVMPSTSHMHAGPVSPTDLHSPLHPPARPNTSTYTPLLKKGHVRKLSPTRKPPSPTRKPTSPTRKLPSPTRRVSNIDVALPLDVLSSKAASRTPVSNERRETLIEERRLATLSGRKQLRRSIEEELRKAVDDDAQSISSVRTFGVASSSQDDGFDPDELGMDDEARERRDFRQATDKIEIVDVTLERSPLEKCHTLNVTAISPRKKSKSLTSLRSQDSESSSLSSKSGQERKQFTIGSPSNPLKVNLTISDRSVKRTSSVPQSFKKKAVQKKRADISVLFSSPDRLKKSASDPTSMSRKGVAPLKKRRKIKLYKESMLMPTDENLTESSQSQVTEVLSTTDSDLQLISSSSSDTSQKSNSRISQDSVGMTSQSRQRIESNSTVSSGETVTAMTREERRAHKSRFLEKSQRSLTPRTTGKLMSSPEVTLAAVDSSLGFSLTAAQRYQRTVDSVQDTSFSSGRSARSPPAEDTTALLLVSTFCAIFSQARPSERACDVHRQLLET